MENKRVGFLDEVRGFAIICMVIYHGAFLLKSNFGVNVPIFFDSWFDIIRDIFAGTFIFIAGITCQYSRNNMKRGIQCFFLAMGITYFTSLVFPELSIMFGILHFMGISMMIYAIGERMFNFFPSLIGIAINGVLFIATLNIRARTFGFFNVFSMKVPDFLYESGMLFPLGFPSYGFRSSDYFPLLPWLFLFLCGTYFGNYVKSGLMPRFFYNTRVPVLAGVGRYTLWIYILHQPIIYIILSLIFKKSIF